MTDGICTRLSTKFKVMNHLKPMKHYEHILEQTYGYRTQAIA